MKALKHEERMGNLAGARALLSRLRDDSVERTWKTILEGIYLPTPLEPPADKYAGWTLG